VKIVFLDSWSRDPAKGSGTTVAISTLAHALRAEGHHVHLLGTESRDDSSFLPGRLSFNWRLGDRIRDVDPDVAVGFDVDGFLLPRRRPYPLIVHLKGIAADEARFETGAPHWKLRLLARLEGRNARRADRVVVPSHYSANHAIRRYRLREEKVAVVPEAVDPEPWERLRAEPPPRSSGAPTILTVGRQYPRKNTRTLITAFSRVTGQIPDARLRVVGGGPELPNLRRQALEAGLEDRVELLGPLPEMEDVRREYFRADCFCLPTLQEGFGIVFLEAMSAGLPVVAGRSSSVPEVVADGTTGLLVDPRDPVAIADALIALLTDRSLARRMGEAGIERAAEFTPERTAEGFLRLVRAAVRSRSPEGARRIRAEPDPGLQSERDAPE